MTQVFAAVVTTVAQVVPTTAPAPAPDETTPASNSEPVPAPVTRRISDPPQIVEAKPSTPIVPVGWARAEDGSLVRGSFYTCAGEEWIGAVATPGSVASTTGRDASC